MMEDAVLSPFLGLWIESADPMLLDKGSPRYITNCTANYGIGPQGTYPAVSYVASS